MGQSKKRLEQKLDALTHLVTLVLLKEGTIMAAIDDLLADVQDETTVVGSVEALLTNLTNLLKTAGATPAQIAAVQAVVDANKGRLSAAVVANTPAATP
jgi:hypothetical protein